MTTATTRCSASTSTPSATSSSSPRQFSVEGPSPTRDDQNLEDAEVLFTSAQFALFNAPLEPPLARPKVIWEIFVDEGRLSQCLEKYGSDRVTVEQFSLNN